MEARIEYLYQKAGARIKNQGIMKGWSAWLELWEEQVAQRQMLASAGARLLRPKLAASLATSLAVCVQEAPPFVVRNT